MVLVLFEVTVRRRRGRLPCRRGFIFERDTITAAFPLRRYTDRPRQKVSAGGNHAFIAPDHECFMPVSGFCAGCNKSEWYQSRTGRERGHML